MISDTSKNFAQKKGFLQCATIISSTFSSKLSTGFLTKCILLQIDICGIPGIEVEIQMTTQE